MPLSETAADFNKENVMPKKYLLKNSKKIAHNYSYLGKEDFNHASKLLKVLENKRSLHKVHR